MNTTQKVNAVLNKIELGEDDAYDFVEEEFGTICRFESCELLGTLECVAEMTAWQMVASCPSCEAGANQVLDSKNWADDHVCNWPEGDVKDVGLQHLHAQNAYGIDSSALNEIRDSYEALDHGAVDPYDFLPPSRLGIEGDFEGLYRCPHCGDVFEVVYRAEQ